MRCAGGCAPIALQSSPTLFGDDYEINYTLQLSSVVCAVPFPRLNDMLKLLGMRQLSKADSTATQRESEQPLAHMAHASMARAWEREQRTCTPKADGCLILDDGWNCGRNATDCTQPTMSAATGAVLHLEHSRRSDPGVKSSQALEQRNCTKTVAHPLIKPSEFPQMAVDGATGTLRTLQRAGFDGQGDPWHSIKNRGKAFVAFVDAFAPREDLTAAEQAARGMAKPDRPSQPVAGKAPSLGKLPEEPSPQSAEGMREQLQLFEGERASGTDADVAALYASLRLVQHATAALAALPSSIPAPARLPDLPLAGYAQQLGSVYKVHARQSVMTDAELSVWKAYDSYCIVQANADAARAARTVRNKNLKLARVTARAWAREFRSVYDMTFRYTATLRNATNDATGELWTRDERTALAQHLYPDASLHLAAGFVDAESLRTIRHPSTKQKDAVWSWAPPAQGHVKVRSLVWRILESWVRDPRCLDKFSYYIGSLSQLEPIGCRPSLPSPCATLPCATRSHPTLPVLQTIAARLTRSASCPRS